MQGLQGEAPKNDTAESGEIAFRVQTVRARISEAATRAGRSANEVRLVAVTKTVEAARVAEAVRAGITDLGENYVQEARTKIPEVGAALAGTSASPSWHLIGHLQRNKAKYCAKLFSLIHSVDNYQLAQEIGKHATKQGKTQPVLVEINLADQPERKGAALGDALALCEQVAGVPGVELRGLMSMAPFSEDPEPARPYFARLRGLFEQLPAAHRQTLSMGMSNDFWVAIEEGATLVRIGTAIFGRRNNAAAAQEKAYATGNAFVG